MEHFEQLIAPVIQLLDATPVLLLFLLLGLGYIVGNLSVYGFSLGPVAGVLFVGLFFGHYGLRIGAGAQMVGFALFIFSVGYQAGPRFFSAVKADGIKYLLMAVTVTVTSVSLALLASYLLSLKPGMAAGLLSGGLTSSPTLAAAQDAVREGSVAVPEGYSRDQVLGNIASVYAITYIFGLTGLITIIKYLPKLLKIDLVAEAAALAQTNTSNVPPINITTRWYRVENPEFLAMGVREIRDRYCERIPVANLHREGGVVPIRAMEVLREGDVLELVGPRSLFSSGIQDIGPEIPLEVDLETSQASATLVVTNRRVFGQTLGEIDVPGAFGVIIQKIVRSGVEIPHGYDLELNGGDVLTVVGAQARLDAFGQYVGHMERNLTHTDMISFSLGIVAGVLLGMVSFDVGGIALGLGTAGGLLASGLTIGYLRSVRPTFGRLPEATSWWLMEFGLLLFMAGVGLRAGGSLLETLMHSGPLLVLSGVIVTTVPVFVAYFVGTKWLRLNPAILMGSLTGAMTSGASLSVVTAEARSAVPAIGYAGTYAFGNVLLMVVGPLVVLLG